MQSSSSVFQSECRFRPSSVATVCLSAPHQSLFCTFLPLRLACAVQLSLGKARQQAPHCAPLSPVSDGSAFPEAWVSCSDLQLCQHCCFCLHIVSGYCHAAPLFPSTSFQVHFCICFVQGSIIRGCHISLGESISRLAGHKGTGKVRRCQRVPLLCSQPLTFDTTEVLFHGLFLLHSDQVTNKNRPHLTYHLLCNQKR